jgi:hypothetical protein
MLGVREAYVQVERSEAPGEFVDFSPGSLKGSAKSKVGRLAQPLSSKVSPMKQNWKGEGMGLTRGVAWVLVVVE